MKYLYLLSLLYINNAYSEIKSIDNIKIFVSNRTEPILILNDDKLSGIVGEFFNEATNGIIKKNTILEEPLQRILSDSNKEKNSIIIPLARNEEREDKFIWLFKVYDEYYCFFNTKPNSPITNLDEPNKIGTIGILRGGASSKFINKYKLNNIEYSNDYKSLIPKLHFKRIDALLGAYLPLKYNWEISNYDINDIQCGNKLLKMGIYITTSLNSDKKFINEMTSIFIAK